MESRKFDKLHRKGRKRRDNTSSTEDIDSGVDDAVVEQSIPHSHHSPSTIAKVGTVQSYCVF